MLFLQPPITTTTTTREVSQSAINPWLQLRRCFIMVLEQMKKKSVLVSDSLVMVTGGHDNNAHTSVELLHSNGTRLCSLPNLPAERTHHSQTGLLICWRRSCITFTAGSWKETHTLGQQRIGHTAWASPRGVLLMGSGDRRQKTTELLTDEGRTTPSFALPTHLEYNIICKI